MSFAILDNMTPVGSNLFYEDGFRQIIESHLNILANAYSKKQSISGDLVYQYEGNFYGYLLDIGIQPEYHWIFLRVNGFTNNNQFGAELRDPYQRNYEFILIHPSIELIDELAAQYNTLKK